MSPIKFEEKSYNYHNDTLQESKEGVTHHIDLIEIKQVMSKG